jgi:hypothetical protein
MEALSKACQQLHGEAWEEYCQLALDHLCAELLTDKYPDDQ